MKGFLGRLSKVILIILSFLLFLVCGHGYGNLLEISPNKYNPDYYFIMTLGSMLLLLTIIILFILVYFLWWLVTGKSLIKA